MRKLIIIIFVIVLSCSSLCAHRAYGDDSWSFVVLGDTRGDDYKNTGVSAYLPAIASKISALKPSAVFVAGDLINGGDTTTHGDYTAQFSNWKTAIKSVTDAGILI